MSTTGRDAALAAEIEGAMDERLTDAERAELGPDYEAACIRYERCVEACNEAEAEVEAEGERVVVRLLREREAARAALAEAQRSPMSRTLSAHDHVRELVAEVQELRERAAEHHRRGDEARAEAARLRAQIQRIRKAVSDLPRHLGASWWGQQLRAALVEPAAGDALTEADR